MKSSKVKKIVLAGISLGLIAVMVIAGTVAYLQGSTEELVNTFSTNNVEVNLKETTGNTYNIVPGTEQKKDPKVIVDNSLDSYVYVKVTDTSNGVIEYEMAEGWTELDAVKYPGVYYREVAKNAELKEFSVLRDDKVSYSASLTNETMPKENVILSFQAFAIQKSPFGVDADGNAIENGPVNAYVAVSTGVVADTYRPATADTLSEVLEEAEAGDVIVLSGEVAPEQPLTIKEPVTIVGDDSTVIKENTLATYADVTFKNVSFEKPENEDRKATMVYGYKGTEELVFDGCTFSNPQWEVVQITSNDFKSLVINNCTFNANDVDSAEGKGYGSEADQAIRYIHIEPSNSKNNIEVTITNNTFNDIAKVKDSIVGIYYVTGTITVGGNTFSGWGEGDVTNGRTGKLSVGWPEVEDLKTISVWESSDFSTYNFK